jgi:hypothetical protein
VLGLPWPARARSIHCSRRHELLAPRTDPRPSWALWTLHLRCDSVLVMDNLSGQGSSRSRCGEPSDAAKHQAALLVAERSGSTPEARLILEMLGLSEQAWRDTTAIPRPRKP